MTEWVCSKCGSAGAHPLPFTQLDARYATGYCDVCTAPNPPTPRKGPRPTSELVDAAHFDVTAFHEKKEKTQLSKLIHKFAAGKDKVSMSARECWLLVSLWDKWGEPGFTPTDSLRKAAAEYQPRTAKAKA